VQVLPGAPVDWENISDTQARLNAANGFQISADRYVAFDRGGIVLAAIEAGFSQQFKNRDQL
jgi:hypothetical protein